MPLYDFESEDGLRSYQEFFNVKDRPPIGSFIERDGERWRRVFSTSVEAAVASNCYHVAHSLPRWKPKSKSEKCPYPHVDERGRAVFTSKREIESFQSISGGRYKYDIGD